MVVRSAYPRDRRTGRSAPVTKVTLQTIADIVGVSRMTVSNAYSRPDQLSNELRERILTTAAELGYAGPDPKARALARGTTGAVGVLLTRSLRYAFTDAVATQFLGALAQELGPTGLALTLLPSFEVEDVMPSRDVAMDGAVVYATDFQSEAVQWLHRRKLPMAFVDQPPEPGIDCVNIDDRGGGRAAANHLLGLGHRRIGIVTDGLPESFGLVDASNLRPRYYATTERIGGWMDGLSAEGVTPVVAHADGRTYDATRLLLGLPQRPTGLLCFSDSMVHEVYKAAHDAGLSVPEDLSVVGFDDARFARNMRPALTTVYQDVSEKGRAAAVALRAAMDRSLDPDGAPPPQHAMLATELVVRESTGPAPSR
jgi:DNA-binding LacI/PurR family transcriptional regulator